MMEGCCGGMGIGMMLIGLLGVVLLIVLIVWLVKQIKK
jgi:flagellar biogenesis protein FliO